MISLVLEQIIQQSMMRPKVAPPANINNPGQVVLEKPRQPKVPPPGDRNMLPQKGAAIPAVVPTTPKAS